MKAPAFTALVFTIIVTSCDATPQQGRKADTVHAKPAPGVKVIPQDSPADTRMPVMRTDTGRQEHMPVLQPPKNVQTK